MKKPVFATIFTILAFATLCGLGYWQLQRLEWKNGIVKKLDAEYTKDAAQNIISPSDLSKQVDYRRGTLRGVYEYHNQVRVGPRVYGNIPGYQVITPLRLEDNSVILVNRGWVPNEWRFENEEVLSPHETVNVTGMIRKPGDDNPFMPENRPAKDEWYHIVPSEIAAAKGLSDMRPYILYLEGDETSIYPLPQSKRPELRNDHLQYAIFWFVMAGILLIIYGLRFRR
jgi:surfeit locus 1 family protein